MVIGGDRMEEGREVLNIIKTETGSIKILKPLREPTQQEVDNLYETLARIYIKNKTAC